MVGRVSKVPYDDWRPFIMGMCPLALQNHICQVKKKKKHAELPFDVFERI